MTDPRSSGAGVMPANRHLVHIGFPKTGSKYLQHWFSEHPEIGFSQWGIAGFRNAHEMMAAAARAQSRPAWHVTSHEALTMTIPEYRDIGAKGGGPGLPTRQAQRSGCALLESLFQGASILLVTRGFDALVRSLYDELVLGGVTYGFDSFLEALAELAAAGEDPFHYDRLIRDYEAAFGPDRLIVLPYELLRDRPRDFLGEIERRLGIERLDGPPGRIRATPGPERIELYRRLTKRIRSVPLPRGLKGPLLEYYVHAMRTGRLNPLARMAGALRRGANPAAKILTPDLLQSFSGRCERLRDNSHYADFGSEYLF
jgi:hypothetical protein